MGVVREGSSELLTARNNTLLRTLEATWRERDVLLAMAGIIKLELLASQKEVAMKNQQRLEREQEVGSLQQSLGMLKSQQVLQGLLLVHLQRANMQLRDALAQREEDASRWEAKASSLQQALAQREKDASRWEAKASSLQQALAQREEDASRWEAKASSLQQALAQREDDASRWAAKASSLQRALANREDDASRWAAKASSLQRALAQREEDASRWAAKASSLQQALAQREEDASRWAAKASSLQQAVAQREEDASRWAAKASSLQQALAQRKEDASRWAAKASSLQRALAQREKDASRREAKASSLQRALAQREEDACRWEAKASSLQRALAQREEDASRWEAKASSLQRALAQREEDVSRWAAKASSLQREKDASRREAKAQMATNSPDSAETLDSDKPPSPLASPPSVLELGPEEDHVESITMDVLPRTIRGTTDYPYGKPYTLDFSQLLGCGFAGMVVAGQLDGVEMCWKVFHTEEEAETELPIMFDKGLAPLKRHVMIGHARAKVQVPSKSGQVRVATAVAMEQAAMSLGHAMDEGMYDGGGQLNLEPICQNLCGLLTSLNKLHLAGRAMGDIKSDNVLIMANGDVVLGDLGGVRKVNQNGYYKFGKIGDGQATPKYFDPEAARQRYISIATDIYGFGQIIDDILQAGEENGVSPITQAYQWLASIRGQCCGPACMRPDCPTLLEKLRDFPDFCS